MAHTTQQAQENESPASSHKKEEVSPEGDWVWGVVLFLVVLTVQLFKLF